jgi:hypothetical protein
LIVATPRPRCFAISVSSFQKSKNDQQNGSRQVGGPRRVCLDLAFQAADWFAGSLSALKVNEMWVGRLVVELVEWAGVAAVAASQRLAVVLTQAWSVLAVVQVQTTLARSPCEHLGHRSSSV